PGRVYGIDDGREFTRLPPRPVVSDAVVLESKVRVLALEGEWREAGKDYFRLLSGGIYRGLDALGADSEMRVMGVRFGEYHDLDFTRVRLSGMQTNQFGQHWQGVLSAAAYWSDDVLPESEQALFGDRNFGRGYASDQGRGDRGWGLGYEISRSFLRDDAWLKLLQPYMAVDMARTDY